MAAQGAPTAQTSAEASKEAFRQQIRQQVLDATKAAQQAAEQSSGRGGTFVSVPPLPGFRADNEIPRQAVDLAYGLFVTCAVMVIGWPLARAFGRRIEKRSDVPAVTPVMVEQLQRIEQAVEAMSIEIERISESQRFMVRLQSVATPEPVALPAERR